MLMNEILHKTLSKSHTKHNINVTIEELDRLGLVNNNNHQLVAFLKDKRNKDVIAKIIFETQGMPKEAVKFLLEEFAGNRNYDIDKTIKIVKRYKDKDLSDLMVVITYLILKQADETAIDDLVALSAKSKSLIMEYAFGRWHRVLEKQDFILAINILKDYDNSKYSLEEAGFLLGLIFSDSKINTTAYLNKKPNMQILGLMLQSKNSDKGKIELGYYEKGLMLDLIFSDMGNMSAGDIDRINLLFKKLEDAKILNLATENNALAIKIFLNSFFRQSLNDNAITDIGMQYKIAIKLSRSIYSKIGDNILNLSTYRLERMVEVALESHYNVVDNASRIEVLNDEVGVFGLHNNETKYDKTRRFVPDGLNRILGLLDINPKKTVHLEIEEVRDAKQKAKEFLSFIADFKSIKQQYGLSGGYFLFNGHGTKNGLFYDENNYISVKDMTNALIEAYKSGVNLEEITIDLSCCYSYYFANTVIAGLKKAGVEKYPQILTAAGYETILGYTDLTGESPLSNLHASIIEYLEKQQSKNELAKGRLSLDTVFKTGIYHSNSTVFITNDEIQKENDKLNEELKSILAEQDFSDVKPAESNILLKKIKEIIKNIEFIKTIPNIQTGQSADLSAGNESGNVYEQERTPVLDSRISELTMTWLSKLLDVLKITDFDKRQKWINTIENPIIILGLFIPGIQRWFIKQHKDQSPEAVKEGINAILKQAGLISADFIPTMGLIKMLTNRTTRINLSKAHAFWNAINNVENIVSVDDVLNRLALIFPAGYEFSEEFKKKIQKMILTETLGYNENENDFIDRIIAKLFADLLENDGDITQLRTDYTISDLSSLKIPESLLKITSMPKNTFKEIEISLKIETGYRSIFNKIKLANVVKEAIDGLGDKKIGEYIRYGIKYHVTNIEAGSFKQKTIHTVIKKPGFDELAVIVNDEGSIDIQFTTKFHAEKALKLGKGIASHDDIEKYVRHFYDNESAVKYYVNEVEEIIMDLLTDKIKSSSSFGTDYKTSNSWGFFDSNKNSILKTIFIDSINITKDFSTTLKDFLLSLILPNDLLADFGIEERNLLMPNELVLPENEIKDKTVIIKKNINDFLKDPTIKKAMETVALGLGIPNIIDRDFLLKVFDSEIMHKAVRNYIDGNEDRQKKAKDFSRLYGYIAFEKEFFADTSNSGKKLNSNSVIQICKGHSMPLSTWIHIYDGHSPFMNGNEVGHLDRYLTETDALNNAIRFDDMQNVEMIIKDPDVIIYGKKNGFGQNSIVYIKNISGKVYVYVETIGDAGSDNEGKTFFVIDENKYKDDPVAHIVEQITGVGDVNSLKQIVVLVKNDNPQEKTGILDKNIKAGKNQFGSYRYSKAIGLFRTAEIVFAEDEKFNYYFTDTECLRYNKEFLRWEAVSISGILKDIAETDSLRAVILKYLAGKMKDSGIDPAKLKIEDIILPDTKDGIFGVKYTQKYKFFNMEGEFVGEIKEQELESLNEGIVGFVYRDGAFIAVLKDGQLQLKYRSVVQSDAHKYIYNGGLTDKADGIIEIIPNERSNTLYKFGDMTNPSPKQLYKIEYEQLFKFEGEWKVCKGKEGKNINLSNKKGTFVISVFNNNIEESKLADMVVAQIKQINGNVRIYPVIDGLDVKDIVLLDKNNNKLLYKNKPYQLPNMKYFKQISFQMTDKNIVVMNCDGKEKGILCAGYMYTDAEILNKQYEYIFHRGRLLIQDANGELVASCKNGNVKFITAYELYVFGKKIKIKNLIFKGLFSIFVTPFREKKEIDKIHKGEIDKEDFLIKHKGYRDGGKETRALYESRLDKLLGGMGRFTGFAFMMGLTNIAIHMFLNIQALITGSVLLTITDDDYSKYINKLEFDKESFEYISGIIQSAPEIGNIINLIKSDNIPEAKKIIYSLLETLAKDTETELKGLYAKIYSGAVLGYTSYEKIAKYRLMKIQTIVDKYFKEFEIDNLPVQDDDKDNIAESGLVNKDQSINILYEKGNEILSIEIDCMGLKKLMSRNKDIMDTPIHQILGIKDVDLGIDIQIIQKDGKWGIIIKRGANYNSETKITIIDDENLPKYTAPSRDETVSGLKQNNKKELDALNINIDDSRTYKIIMLDDILTSDGEADVTKLPDVRNIPLLVYPIGYGVDNDSLSDKDRYNLFSKNLGVFIDLGYVLFEKLLGKQLEIVQETEPFFVREALKNAFIHGNNGDVNKPIYIICGYDEATKEYYISFYNQQDKKTSSKILAISAASYLSGSHLGAISLKEGVGSQKDLYSGSGTTNAGMFFTYLTNSNSYDLEMQSLIEETNSDVVKDEKSQIIEKYLPLVEQDVSEKYGKSPEIRKLIIDMIEAEPTFVLTDFNEFVAEVEEKLEKAEDKLINRIDGKLGDIMDIIPNETLKAIDDAIVQYKYKGYTLEQVKNISDSEIQKMADEILKKIQPIADKITGGDSQEKDIVPAEMIKDVINPVTIITKTAVRIVSAENINEELTKQIKENGLNIDVKSNLIITDDAKQAENLREQGFNVVSIRTAFSKEMKGRKGLIIGEREGKQIRAYLDKVTAELIFYSNDETLNIDEFEIQNLKSMFKNSQLAGINSKMFEGIEKIIIVENDSTLESVINAMKNTVTDGLSKPPVSISLDFSDRKDVASASIERITNGETNNGIDSNAIIFNASQLTAMNEETVKNLQAKGYEIILLTDKISEAEEMINRLHINGAVIKTNGRITESDLKKIKQISDANVNGTQIIKTQMFIEELSDETLSSLGDIYEQYSIIPVVTAGSLYPQTGQKCSVRINDKDSNTAGLFERSNVVNIISDKVSTVKKSTGRLADIITDILKPATPKQKFITELKNINSAPYDTGIAGIKDILKNKNSVLFKLITSKEWFEGEDERANEEKLKEAINALLSENILNSFTKSRVEQFMKEGKYYEALGCIRGSVEKTVESIILSKLETDGVDIMSDKLKKYAGGILRDAIVITGIRLLVEGKDIEALLEDAFIDSNMTARQYFDSIMVRLNGHIKDIIKTNEYAINTLSDEMSTAEAISDFKDFNLLMQDQVREKLPVKKLGVASSFAIRSILGAA